MKFILAALLALPAAAQPQHGQAASQAHEEQENKAWTVPGGASKGVQACHVDIENFCKRVKPGAGRLGRCLKKNAKKLSKPCRNWLAHGGQAHADEAFSEIDASTAPARTPPPADR